MRNKLNFITVFIITIAGCYNKPLTPSVQPRAINKMTQNEILDTIAKKPPMGWNSYNCFGGNVTETEVKANADYMAEKLKQFGWEYIVVDFLWYCDDINSAEKMANRRPHQYIDEFGRLIPSVKLHPSSEGGKGLKPLGGYIHSKGLKFGLHIMRGIPRQAIEANTPVKNSQVKAADIANLPDTCVWYGGLTGVNMTKTGAQEYYNSLFELYAEWGVDYIKVDDIVFPYHADEIEAVRKAGGICFIAHPEDGTLPAFNETDISWVNWDVTGYTGIELWNGFSELKSVARGKWDAVAYAFFPAYIPHGPLPETLRRWDELTAQGRQVVAVGGSDAHAQHLSMGPLHRIIFPYAYHFSSINTHTLVPSPLSGDLAKDRKMVFDALANGHCYVGYDLPAPTRGFRFSAQGREINAIMGDEIVSSTPVTLQAKLPSPAEMQLLKNGKVIKSTDDEMLTYITDGPGVYRIEAYIHFLGKMRGWVFSNPIYVR